ncbi:MAG: ABC transporter substrate-binding protein, partial [Deltaproteobacteria bacterium]|nr:ABC transporter substrate-binding protein [Deltaproteobacteria bacterium]
MRRSFAAALAAAFLLSSLAAPARADQKLRIGTGIDPVYTTYYVAESLGLFKKHGVDAELKLFSRGGEALDALMAGELQAQSSAEYPDILAIDKNPDVIIVGVSCVAPHTIKLTARADIKKPQDFIGKKIGSALGSVTDYCFDKYFEKNGVDRSKVNYVNVPPPESVPLLDKGDISAFFYWEPWPSKALEVSGSKVHILGSSAQLGVYSSKLFITVPRSFAEKNPDTIKNFLKALSEAGEYAQQNPQEAHKIVAKKIPSLTPEAIA